MSFHQQAIHEYKPITSPLDVHYQGAPAAVRQQIAALSSQQMQAYIYYLRRHLQPHQIPRMIVAVPQVAVNADRGIVLQNGRVLSATNEKQLLECSLLNYQERRQSRKKVIVKIISRDYQLQDCCLN